MTEKDYEKLKQIEVAITSFNSKKLYESSIAFYKALDYQSNKTVRLTPNNFEGFLDSFNLSKNSINKEKALVEHWKQIEFIFQVGDAEITRIQSLFDTQSVDTNEYQSFLFFTLQLKEDGYKRAELVRITRELNVPFKMPVIVLFHYGNKLTLSIIDRRLHKKDTSKDVLEKVTLIKDIDIANPQRAHKEILKDLSLNELYRQYEFHSFVKLHEAWKATLNISELNKKFYKELAYWYFWALQEVEFPDDELKDEKSRNPVNVIRLITRLIFVWFLKEKNLVPDELFNKRELDRILDYKDKTGSTYYKAILQNLFFATLNTEMNKDVKDKNKISRTFVNRNTGVPHYFRYGKFIKDQERFAMLMDNIPFLNGGLFECLDKRFKDSSKDIFIDGFTQQVKNETRVKVPDYLFFTDAPRNIDLNKTFNTKGKKYEVQGLIDILSRYKFTIEENTPVEEEVALDPELLGKVFENLLASYNEETETTARKLTGSFYTPREIVNYMVDESLITYLSNTLLTDDDEKQREVLNDKLHHLFSYTAEAPKFTDTEKAALINAIDNCKILDPACGSGAFPMGVLHKLVYVLSKLDPNNRSWKQKQLEKAKRDKTLAEKMEDERNRETALAEIDKRIEDIEKAFNEDNNELDFGRKLYLIENCIYGVDKQPIAIQISKLRFFIALIVDQKTTNEKEPNRGIRPLPNLETKFVAADTLISIEKPQQLTLMNQDEELQKAIKDKEAEIHTVRDKHFRARTPDTKEKYRLLDAQLRDELAALLEKDGFPKDETRKLAQWNPYDQNKFAEFFDPMWMFEIENGFDIVIGNPPYVAGKSGTLSKEQKAIYNKQFTTAEYQLDTYVLFTEKGIGLCNKNGVLVYIMPNTWLANIKLTKIRKFLLDNTSVQQIVINPSNVFSEAVVDTIILIAEKKRYNENNIKIATFTENAVELKSIQKQKFFLTNEKYIFDIQLNKSDKHLFKAIENGNLLIKDICEVNRGVHAYRKDGYGISKFSKGFQTERDYLERSYHSTKKLDKTYLPEVRGKNVFPYKVEKSGEYISWGIWLAEPREMKYFEGERIYLRKIVGKTLFAAFVDDKNIADQSVYIAKLKKPKISTKYLLAILNSYLLTWYFRVKSNEFDDLFPQIKVTEFKELPIKIIDNQKPISKLVDFIIHIKSENINDVFFTLLERILNGCVYELYFGEEMKKAGVDILALVEKDLEAVKELPTEKAITTLYEKWQEPKNEVRNRLLLMATRCPDTIGVIEASIK
jgi:type I restriction-modification system DNA methylase subunit